MSVRRLLALLSAALIWIAASSPARQQHIVLISIDTLRASHLGCYGSTSGASPNIDQLAAKSLLFTQAYTTAPLTLPAHASMLTGLSPAHHKKRDNAFFDPAAAPLISELLKKQGYKTAAFISGAPLLSSFGLNRGFDVYDDFFPGQERTAAETTEAAVRWIQSQKSSYFVWVHYFDPHAEYRPPAAFSQFKSPYDGEIAYVDSQVPRLLAAAGTDATILLTADHGESLGEHGESTHGIFLYDATLRIPLLISGPRIKPGTRTDAVSICDIAPSILAIAQSPQIKTDGVSLLNAAGASRMLLAESLYAARNFGYAPLFASIRNQQKYILAPEPEFYNLQSDPGEKQNLAGSANTSEWARAARVYAAAESAPAAGTLTEEQAEKLRSLGYVGAALPAGKADPKAKIVQAEAFNTAMGALSRGDAAAAESAFRAIVGEEPSNALAFRFLGDALSAQNKPDKASEAYASSWKLLPDPDVGVRLAKSRFRTGAAGEAQKTLESVVQQFPAYEPASLDLASMYASGQRYEEALAVLKANTPEMHNQRGIFHLRMQQYDKAELEFSAAIEGTRRPEYLNNLGLALQRQDRAEEAESAFRDALTLNPGYQECEVNLAFLLIQQQKWDLALAHLAHLTDGNPQLWNARMAHAYVLEKLGRPEEAVQKYSALLKDAPADWPQRRQVEARLAALAK